MTVLRLTLLTAVVCMALWLAKPAPRQDPLTRRRLDGHAVRLDDVEQCTLYLERLACVKDPDGLAEAPVCSR